MPSELYGKKIGIIGMGAVGEHVLRIALGLGMSIYYFSRTRKPKCETLGAKFLDKKDLLHQCEIVSLHVPKGTDIMKSDDFAAMRSGTVLVNTSLGLVFDVMDFEHWIDEPTNFAILDECADVSYQRYKDRPNVIYPQVTAGRTAESRARLSEQVVSNLQAFLDGKPQNLINKYPLNVN